MQDFLKYVGRGLTAVSHVMAGKDFPDFSEKAPSAEVTRELIRSRDRTHKLMQEMKIHEDNLAEKKRHNMAEEQNFSQKLSGHIAGSKKAVADSSPVQGKITATERLKVKDIVTAAGELAKLAHTAEQADKVFSRLETGGTTAQVISNPRALSMIPGNSAQKDYALADKLTSDLVTKHGQQMKGVRALGIYNLIERGKPSVKNPKDTNREIFSNYRSAMAEDAETLLAHAEDAKERGLLSEGEYQLVRKRCAPLMGVSGEEAREEKEEALPERPQSPVFLEENGGDEDEDEERERLELLRQDPRIQKLLSGI